MKLSRLLPFSLLLLISITIRAQETTKLELASLHGLRGVEVIAEETSQEMQDQGIVSDEMRGRVEGRLRAAGVHVDSGVRKDNAMLYLRVTAIDHPSGVYAVYVRLEVNQRGLLDRNMKIATLATTWGKGILLAYKQDDLRLSLKAVDLLVDDFIKDFGRANSLSVKPKTEAQHKF